MTTLNTENQMKDDDERLVFLLIEHIEEPPIDLAEKTLSKFLALQTEQKIAFRPLRIPLYAMSAVSLLLILPLLKPGIVDRAAPGLISELLHYQAGPAITYSITCWLILTGLAILVVTTSRNKHRVQTFK